MIEDAVERLRVKIALIDLDTALSLEEDSLIKRLIVRAMEELQPLVGKWTPPK